MIEDEDGVGENAIIDLYPPSSWSASYRAPLLRDVRLEFFTILL